MQVLQHTSPQIYTKEDWNRISCVPVSTRIARIAFALDLGKYVLAFVMQDMLFVVSFSLFPTIL